jgi:hypothetical protein
MIEWYAMDHISPEEPPGSNRKNTVKIEAPINEGTSVNDINHVS